MKTEIQKILNTDMAHIGCLLSLLAEHPDVEGAPTLYGAMAAIQSQFTAVWEKLETEVEAMQ